MKTLIIIPAFNEESNILKTYNSILDYNQNHKDNTFDVIVINDCSTDNTLKILQENNISHINLIHNLGIGGAVQTGYKYACDNNYDIAVQFDGDGQHDINYVQNIINPIIENNADFVIGSRFIDKNISEFKSSLQRRIGIKLISIAIKIVTKNCIYDTTSGFRAMNKSIIARFAKEYPIEYPEPITNAELIKLGYRLSEVPVKMYEREGGESSIKAWKTVYYMLNVLFNILIIGIRRYSNEY